MALFDRVDSGFPELDEALDYFRIGDNVVYDLEDQDCHIYYDFLSEKLLGLIHEP